jgi:peroxiredoxin
MAGGTSQGTGKNPKESPGDEAGERTVNIGAVVVGFLAVVIVVGVAWVAFTLLPGAGGETADSPALATVNGQPVSVHDVDVELAVQKGVQAQKGKQLQEDEETIRAFRRELLDQLIDVELMVQAATAAGMSVTDEEVASELPALGEEFAVSMDDLRQYVVDAGVPEADFTEWARRGILMRRYLETDEARDIGLEALRERGVEADQGIFMNVTKDDVATGLQSVADIRFFSEEGADVSAAVEGEPAPEFTLADVDGNMVSLSDFRGQPVMVNFWATWCKPCALEMPMFISTYEANKDDGLVVLAINVQEAPDEVKAHVDENDLALPVILDRDGQVSTIYRVRGLPSTFFIDSDGNLVEARRGAVQSRADLAEMLQKIMPDAEVWAPSRSPGAAASVLRGGA